MNEILAFQHLRTTNDTNGNPRRAWVVYGANGAIVRINDEGYNGRAAVRGLEVAGIPELDPVEVTPKTYNALRRHAMWAGEFSAVSSSQETTHRGAE